MFVHIGRYIIQVQDIVYLKWLYKLEADNVWVEVAIRDVGTVTEGMTLDAYEEASGVLLSRSDNRENGSSVS